jgi:hypothetical protein
MNEQNIDVNLIIESFQERISQLLTEVVVQNATIKQLMSKLEELNKLKNTDKKDK